LVEVETRQYNATFIVTFSPHQLFGNCLIIITKLGNGVESKLLLLLVIIELLQTIFNDDTPPSQSGSLQSSQVLWCSFSLTD
jgi:hypothetical protein